MSALAEEVRAVRGFRPATAKALREAAGVSQQRLADELGVNRVTIARWELGQRRPRPAVLVRYNALLRELAEPLG